MPSQPRLRFDYFETDPRYVDPRLAGTGLTFEAGGFFPGDNLGSGFGGAVSVQWTPFGIAEAAGFGLGGSIGFKGNSFHVSQEVGVQSRFPLLAAVHTLVPFTIRHFLLLRAGIQTDRGISRREGVDGEPIAAPLTSKPGFVAEVGLYLPFSRHLGGAMSFRHTSLRDAADGADQSADSLGALSTLHVVP